jgi:hypothetical protein
MDQNSVQWSVEVSCVPVLPGQHAAAGFSMAFLFQKNRIPLCSVLELSDLADAFLSEFLKWSAFHDPV